MRPICRLICAAILAATFWLTPDGARAALSGACTVPDYLLSSDYRLRRVAGRSREAEVVKDRRRRHRFLGAGGAGRPEIGLSGATGSRFG